MTLHFILAAGIFPYRLKWSAIKSVHKKGDKTYQITNQYLFYRINCMEQSHWEGNSILIWWRNSSQFNLLTLFLNIWTLLQFQRIISYYEIMKSQNKMKNKRLITVVKWLLLLHILEVPCLNISLETG